MFRLNRLGFPSPSTSAATTSSAATTARPPSRFSTYTACLRARVVVIILGRRDRNVMHGFYCVVLDLLYKRYINMIFPSFASRMLRTMYKIQYTAKRVVEGRCREYRFPLFRERDDVDTKTFSCFAKTREVSFPSQLTNKLN